MRISEMSSREKSLMIAKSCPYFIILNDPRSGDYIQHVSGWSGVDLYHTDNMAIAWLVLNWAINGDRINIHGCFNVFAEIGGWLRSEFVVLASISPAEAQRRWLDKIIESAIEAGLIENETN